jgi:hypothetical protein
MELSQEAIRLLNGLSPEQLSALIGTTTGRSPFKRRQLDDLTLLPTATDPRPTFFFDMKPRDFPPTTHSEFPKLLWRTKDGLEITVHDKEEQETKLAHGYQLRAPDSGPADPVDQLQQMFDELSVEDQQFLLNAEREYRLNLVRERLAKLPKQSAEAIMGTAKRGPGRPRKADSV